VGDAGDTTKDHEINARVREVLKELSNLKHRAGAVLG
jgi:hypothetical protein